MNTEQLAKDIHAIAFVVGAKLIQAQKRCDEGMDIHSEESETLGREARELFGLQDGFLYAAKLLLDEDDWHQFVYRCGLTPQMIEESIARAKAKIPSLPL
jgi:hypothetical protein